MPSAARTPTGRPQWRGPNRDGTLAAFAEPKAWPEQLTQRWKVEVGTGYATPIVVGNRVFAFSRQAEKEVMRALDADNGRVLWESSYAAPFKMNPATSRHGPGPKSTPTFADGRLFTLGMSGIVTAFDAATGKVVWQNKGEPAEQIATPRSRRSSIAASSSPVGGDKGRVDGVRSGDRCREMEVDRRCSGYASPIII